MNAEKSLKLARRFIELPVEKRRLFLEGLHAERIDFSQFPIVAGVETDDRYALSYAQQRMWFLWQLDRHSGAYNLPMAVRLNGELSVTALEQAFVAMLQRHETLRTTFAQGVDEQLRQVPGQAMLRVEHIDLCDVAGQAQEQRMCQLAEEEALRPFDLETGPLLRVTLLKLGAQAHVLLLTLHHIVADGWSMNVLIDEFLQCYDAFEQGRQPALSALPIQYVDYALWQRKWLEAGEQERQLGYWRAKLGDDHMPLALPYDNARPATPSHLGGRHAFELPAGLVDSLRGLAKAQEVTLFMVLLAAFKVLLQRYSGQQAIRVGVPVANRNRAEVEGLIGCFINTQVLQTEIDPLMGVPELLQRVRETAVGAQAHQELPYERLVEALDLPRGPGQSGLFQVLFNHQANVADTAQIVTRSGLCVEKVNLGKHSARFDLSLDTYESAGKLHAAFTYAFDVFKPGTIQVLAEHWQYVLRGLVAAPDTIGELPLEAGVPEARSVPVTRQVQRVDELITNAVRDNPQGVAAVSGGNTISYQALAERTNALAHKLVSAGVEPDQRVGVIADRSIDMVVAIVAVLKAGAAYLPLEPEQPAERMAYMLADSDVQLVIGGADWQARLPANVRLVCGDPTEVAVDAPVVRVSGDNLAYVIYTSGTTGLPKGVGISHAALVNYVQAIGERLDLHAFESLAMVTTPAADLGHTLFYGALCSGKTLHLLDKDTVLDAEAFASYMVQHRVDALKIVPSHLQAMLAAGARSLPRRCLVLGGEAISSGLLDSVAGLAPQLKILNHYGPTETTVGVLTHPLQGQVVLGAPLQNLRVQVLDACLQAQPVGLKGELYIAGAGLARGYLGRPGLTAERFVPDPSGNGERMYRSGDWMTRDRAGQLHFCGRIDGQVKIRGHRIELSEVENCLRRLPGIQAAVARCAGVEGNLQLVAYLVPQATRGEADLRQSFVEQVREALRASLPEHMVPAHILLLDALPVTANGKLDVKALPAPVASRLTYRAPSTHLQETIARIWADVLQVEQVGLDDNFFALGGHSLLATQVVSRARKQLALDVPLRALFDTFTLETFCNVLQGLDKAQDAQIETVDRADQLALSHAQYRQWMFWKLHPQSAAYNTPLAIRLRGELDHAALQAAFNLLVARHESLRTVFEECDGMPWQHVQAPLPVNIAWHDLAGQASDAVTTMLDHEAASAFDLQRGPLLRVSLYRVDAQEHVLGLMMHHIVSDGWSMSVMVRELAAAYNASVAGRSPVIEPLPVQYVDYAAWQRKRLADGQMQAQLSYWKDKLEDDFTVLELPTDRTRPKEQSHRGDRIDIRLPDELTASLRHLAVATNSTLFHVLLAAFALLLSRYSGKLRLNIGIPVTNRNRLELEGLIGFFVNTVVARVGLEPTLTFKALLQSVKDTALEAQANKDVPFDALVEALKPERTLGYNPLFQVMYNHLRDIGDQVSSDTLQGLHVEEIDLVEQTAHFDISLNTFERSDGLVATFNYASDLFDSGRIRDMARHWQSLLEAIVEAPGQAIGSLPLLSMAEQGRLLDHWQRSEVSTQRLVHQLIEAQADKSPERVALVCEGRQLTFAQFNAQANRLAHRLIELGVGPESRVAVAMRRSVDILLAFFAVHKAGGAYVPLDVAYPQDRLHYMIEDCDAGLVLTQTDVLEQLALPGNIPALLLDQSQDWEDRPSTNPAVAVVEGNLAYVIYTSGSTGRPKGVAVAHGPLVAHVLAIGERYEMSAADCELQFMSLAFDGAHERWLTALSHGAKLVMRGDDVWSPEQTCDVLHQHGVTVTALPPVYLQQLTEHVEAAGNPPPVRIYCFGGDAVPQASYDQAWRVLRPQYIINGYGPTETVVTPLLWKAGPGDACAAAYAPIGALVGRRTAYVLDSELNLLPRGFAGELYLGGQGVARGYLARPGLTAERFVPDLHAADGSRVYRSGDLTRLREDGLVDYLGRIDYQVKIRGFRIELGEIEAKLQAFEAVREAVVVDVSGPNGKQLAAYVVAAASAQAGAQWQVDLRSALRDDLKAVLPDYMVPAYFMFLDALPLTPNGKLDRKALPQPDAGQLQQAYVAPVSALEQRIAAIWADVLKVEQVGLTDNFFELGGDSIISIQVVSRARQAGIHFTPKALFQHQTVQGLATVASEGEGGLSIDQGPVTGQALLLPIH
ncbi:amino acid adenylation domain-containing protein, partial [Pseudomonas monteilii]|uniref:amino acid adenylation domain-containing protein n=1 Tax=Pseudomonas monteilii TaxID=76759 RepID=UPI00381FC7F0